MRRRLYPLVGRLTTVFDSLRPLLATHRYPLHSPAGAGCDRTGLAAADGGPLTTRWQDGDVIFPRYPSLAHSFWRAQELSIFHRHLARLTPPRLDFGAGDGSFASLLLSRVEIGVDTDAAALAIARRRAVYDRLVESTNAAVPLPGGVAGSIFSNSVLEHVGELDAVLTELARLLRPGGALVFTVPVRRYSDHLRLFFGERATRRINAEASHRNLLEEAEWLTRLAHHGFRPLVVQQYQPDWFTFWYRMLRFLGPRALGRAPGIQQAVWGVCGARLVEMVRRSIHETDRGANVFVVAERAGGQETRR